MTSADDEEYHTLHQYFVSNGGINKPSWGKKQSPEELCSVDEQIVPFITNEYGLLRRVFSFFSVVELCNARKVCRSWDVAGEKELADRARVSGTTWSCFSLHNGTKSLSLLKDSIYFPPSMALCFASDEMESFTVDTTPEEKLFDHLKTLFVNIEVPLFVVTSTAGMVGTTTDLTCIREGPTLCNITSSVVSVLLLPRVPDVRIQQFSMPFGRARLIMNIDHQAPENREWMLHELGLPNDEIRTMIIFISEKLHQIEPSIIFKALQRRQAGKLIIGGAFLSPSKDVRRRGLGIYGIAFYGSNIEASSLALTLGCKTPDGVDKRMELFSASVVRGRHNTALMFTCCSRGLKPGRYAERNNMDSLAFQRHFPGTPLHGIIGLGEIGCDWLPVENGVVLPKTSDPEWLREHVQQQYACVILHLAFGLD